MAAGGGTAPIGGFEDAGGEATELVVPPTQMRQLTSFEFDATVADVLGVEDADSTITSGEIDGFDNISVVQQPSPELLARLLQSAEAVAHRVFESPVLRARWPVCAEGDAECVTAFVEKAALRLFRRPALEGELTPIVALYDVARRTGAEHDVALEQVLTALLTSSQFLYRMELVNGEGVAPLDSYAIATRLSYLLWSSAPDETLLSAAANDELQSDDGISAAVVRLLDDPRAARFSQNFAGQWLRFRRLQSHAVDIHFFDWREGLEQELRQEAYDYFTGFVRAERPWQDFLSAPLAAPGQFRQALYAPDGETRRGFLSLPAFLTVTSLDRRTSPTYRGVFIRSQLLCDPPPPPPPEVPPVEPEDPLLQGVRANVEAISRKEPCGKCHVLMDPLGLALEHYDLVGQYRTEYADDGIPVDTSVRVEPNKFYPEGLTLTGLDDVSAYVAQQPKFMTCLVQKLYTFGLGRPIEDVDRDNYRLLAERWQEGSPTLRQALATLALSEPFRYRNPGGAP